LRNVHRGPIIDDIMLRIVVRHPRKTHVHRLNTMDDVPYGIMQELIDFIMGRVLSGGRAMGCNGRQWAAMCGNRATLVMPKT
jgi:hypothetical protein